MKNVLKLVGGNQSLQQNNTMTMKVVDVDSKVIEHGGAKYNQTVWFDKNKLDLINELKKRLKELNKNSINLEIIYSKAQKKYAGFANKTRLTAYTDYILVQHFDKNNNQFSTAEVEYISNSKTDDVCEAAYYHLTA